MENADNDDDSIVREKLYCWGIDPKTWRLKMRSDRQTLSNNNRNDCKNQSVDYTKIREINMEKLLKNGYLIQKMVAGQSHTLLLTDQGTIFTFGNGRDGQL
ncbi:hypothetical protein BLA29_014271, partial [Euroglyphus maynei]